MFFVVRYSYQMKKILFILAVGIIVFVVVRSHSFAFNTASKNVEAQSLSRPYVVEIFDAQGNISNEIKGISNSGDPFLISKDLGAGPFVEDRFKAFPDIRMNMGSKITLYRAPLIKIKDGKRSKEIRSWQKTVGELFAEQKIEIGKDDKVNFVLDTGVENGMEIAITRVAVTTVVESEAIKYTTVKKSNPNVEKGNKKTLQSGKNGTKNKYYLVRREDGEEVSRKLTKTEVAVDPTDEIVEVGTKVVTYGTGEASWYVRTSAMIGACNLVPKGTKVHVVNLSNGKSVDIVTSGGGGFSGMGRVVDLSTVAFEALGVSTSKGTIPNVRVEKYYPE